MLLNLALENDSHFVDNVLPFILIAILIPSFLLFHNRCERSVRSRHEKEAREAIPKILFSNGPLTADNLNTKLRNVSIHLPDHANDAIQHLCRAGTIKRMDSGTVKFQLTEEAQTLYEADFEM